MRHSSLSLGAVLACIVIGCKTDKPPAAENPVKWTVADATGALRVGAATPVHLAAAIDSGWYIYSITQKSGGPTPMTIAVAPSPPFSIEGNPVGPQPVVIFDKEFGIETERYEGNPSFSVPVTVASASEARPQMLEVKVRYQACNANFCLPARTTALTTPVRMARNP
jgi:DsbC/DsbD-like thiol-disulfide interchange protein